MIEGFIVIIISLLFWGKVSKDTLENNPKLDIVKTIIYFTLTVIIAIFYYKSSQVEISNNRIEIKKLIGTTNQLGESSDSVSIGVNYRMTPNNVKYTTTLKQFRPLGGVEFFFSSIISYSNLSIDTTDLKSIYSFLCDCLENPKINKSYSEKSCLGEIIKRYKEELYQFRPNFINIEHKLLSQSPNAITSEDSVQLLDALHYIFQNQKSLYHINYYPPKRKTFLPFDFYRKGYKKYVKGDKEDGSYCIQSMALLDYYVDPLWTKMGVTKEDQKKIFDTHNVTFNDMYVGYSEKCQKAKVGKRSNTYYIYRPSISDSLLNYIDYFTASDMSQRIFKITLLSEIPLTGLAINFDEPINISAINPSPDLIGMNEVVYMDRDKLDYLKNRSLIFHAKLPTYENKQLLRSLILTTILTAIFSLFCTNLYLCGRGIIRRYYTQSTVSDEDKEKYKRHISIYQYSVITIVIIISAIPIWLYVKYLNNDSLLIKSDKVVYTIGGCIVFLAFVFLLFNIWKGKLISKHQNKKGQND